MSLLDKTEDCFAIGFPKESPYYETFNNTVKEMMDNGELDEIIASHLSGAVYSGLTQGRGFRHAVQSVSCKTASKGVKNGA